MERILLLMICCLNVHCGLHKSTRSTPQEVQLIILGTVQDAGSPHIACKKDCCKKLFQKPDPTRKIISLGIIDKSHNKTFLIEASPDITSQLKHLHQLLPQHNSEIPDATILTHAHIGHYTGLMYFGREATNSKNALIYAMPKMKSFLESNGPWSQLVKIGNIQIEEMQEHQSILLTPQIKIRPFLVPHRDEFSETVGYFFEGPNKKALFIPDIDKWEKWNTDIVEQIRLVDYAFLDATFYDAAEIAFRNIGEIPHPFVIESMKRFENLDPAEKRKIYFIHFNHTNPLLDSRSPQSKFVQQQGFNIARLGMVLEL